MKREAEETDVYQDVLEVRAVILNQHQLDLRCDPAAWSAQSSHSLFDSCHVRLIVAMCLSLIHKWKLCYISYS